MVSEWLRSCRGPSRLAHHGDIWSSLGNKHQKLHRPPFEWTTRSLLWYPFRFVEWKAKSVTTAEFNGDLTLVTGAIFMFLWIQLSLIHITHALSNLFLLLSSKKTCVLLWATVRSDFTEYFNFGFSMKTKKTWSTRVEFDLPNYFSLWAIAELWWFDIDIWRWSYLTNQIIRTILTRILIALF